MTDLGELLKPPSTVVSTVKVDKRDAEEAVEAINNLTGVSCRQTTTDEFDTPPTAVLRVTVDLTFLE